jgi:hypothetical protein
VNCRGMTEIPGRQHLLVFQLRKQPFINKLSSLDSVGGDKRQV